MKQQPTLTTYTGSCYDTLLGEISIVEGEGAICRIKFGAMPKKNVIEQKSELTDQAAAELEEYFKGQRKTFDFPVRAEGTDFQKLIWNELMKIPYGETRTYKDIAIAIGNEKSVRAVGMANHKNPLMVVVPCHRVLGTNGSLTGYAGGLAKKERLLEIEQMYKD